MWFGSFGSNIGTWMQNVVLGAYAAQHFGSARAVGNVVLAQLGPLLLLTIPAGVLADKISRKAMIMFFQTEQLVFSFALAWIARGHPSQSTILWLVLGVGVGNAMSAPAWQSALVGVVGREHLAGALSLNSVMINGSRVIGPVLTAGVRYLGVDTAGIFAINAVTYLFVIYAVWLVDIPTIAGPPDGENGWRGLTTGLRVARRSRIVGGTLLAMATFSLISLPFVGQFPYIALRKFRINPEGNTYGWLYAVWGLGACLGALAIGTIFVRIDKRHVVRASLVAFAGTLALYAWTQHLWLAFPIVFWLGFAYFSTATSLMTVLQTNIDDNVRGRVMSLWFMAFGGTVPIGNRLAGGPLDHYGPNIVLYVGALWALVLVVWVHYRLVKAPDYSS